MQGLAADFDYDLHHIPGHSATHCEDVDIRQMRAMHLDHSLIFVMPRSWSGGFVWWSGKEVTSFMNTLQSMFVEVHTVANKCFESFQSNSFTASKGVQGESRCDMETPCLPLAPVSWSTSSSNTGSR